MRRENKNFTSTELLNRAAQLGAAIRLARIARDLTRQDCAKRARVSPSTLMRIEKGDVSVSFSAWLMTLEEVGLVGLIDPASLPYNDVIGEARRMGDARRRAHKSAGQHGS
jgi:transcriptional regulator with XRE-family HTH domain